MNKLKAIKLVLILTLHLVIIIPCSIYLATQLRPTQGLPGEGPAYTIKDKVFGTAYMLSGLVAFIGILSSIVLWKKKVISEKKAIKMFWISSWVLFVIFVIYLLSSVIHKFL